jgi:hypothetical protein
MPKFLPPHFAKCGGKNLGIDDIKFVINKRKNKALMKDLEMETKKSIKSLLKKYNLNIEIGEDAKGEFVFTGDEGFYGGDWMDSYTRIGMTEELAAPILAVVEDVIPYSYDYYYENLPIRKKETELIYRRMQEVRLKVLHNPLDSTLGKIAERLMYSEFAYAYGSGYEKMNVFF